MAAGGGLRSATYTPNALNQYTSRTVPGAVDILGLASPNLVVTVNGAASDHRRGAFFQKKVAVTNTTSAVWLGITNAVNGGVLATGNLFVPPATESYQYDLDGNLTQDGRWDYTWDAENRLVRMQTRAGVAGPVRRLEFEQDAQGRRIRKQVFDALTGGNLLLDRRFLYDGWNLVVEADPNKNSVRCYLWGLDLSGSEQISKDQIGLSPAGPEVPMPPAEPKPVAAAKRSRKEQALRLPEDLPVIGEVLEPSLAHDCVKEKPTAKAGD